MDISYHLLFLVLCVGLGIWINRKYFTGFIRTAFGIPMPSYVYAAGVSLFMGLLFFVIVEGAMWQIRSSGHSPSLQNEYNVTPSP
jgi:hypothetical protein